MAVTLTWAQASDEPGSIFFALLLLILAVVVLFGVVMFLKKWMRKSAEAGDVGFTLSDLRELHRQGKMTTDEFERAKAQMVASAKAAIARK
ncbi:MAG: hypothetical protein ACREIT_04585, partial [Tepidisphaeraceae bacterium]